MTDSMFHKLHDIIKERQANPKPDSYTNKLLDEGITRIAQKVGEEGVEVVIAALAQDDQTLLNEMADLIYHATVLLAVRKLDWQDVEAVLKARHK